MITVRFSTEGETITGFRIQGHAMLAPSGQDILCAAVSSAAYMTANTITEICKLPADAEVSEGEMLVMLSKADASKAQDLLKGFSLHVRELSHQYPKQLKVIYGGK